MTTTILKVLGTEYSIKPYGIHMGKPMIALRLAGCNLRCRGCIRHRQKGVEMEIGEIVNNISLLNCKHLVITGGEPLKQRMQLVELLKELRGYKIEIETNGTLSSSYVEDYVDYWDICLKLPSSGMRKTKREKPIVIRKFMLLDNVYFTFEINSHQDLYEFTRLNKKYGFNSDKIILMVQKDDMKDLVFEHCKANGYIFQVPLSLVVR